MKGLKIALVAVLGGALAPGFSVFAQDSPLLKLPPSNPGLIFLEAEEAVSTNFAPQPLLNYGASGLQTLQLNKNQAPFGSQVYYSEFVFWAEKEGVYEFWYGGTPPGPRDPLIPSLMSPFTFLLDDLPPREVYREDVTVVENYTPNYYWIKLPPVSLQAGSHRIRFEVPQRRKFDGRYYFYLDAIFFLADKPEDLNPAAVPAVFPKDWQSTKINNPFKSFSEYEQSIKAQPDNPNPYIDLGLVYSLVGDYQNALRYLSRASLLAPDRTDLILLQAKNRIWLGDIQEGLNQYRQVLSRQGDQESTWAEAAKVAAWNGEYAIALELYAQGLTAIPESLNLTVNKGLTHLWNNQSDLAQGLFTRAEELAGNSPELWAQLGKIMEVNGYPDQAAQILNRAQLKFPQEVRFPLLLSQIWRQNGKPSQADELLNQLSSKHPTHEELRLLLVNERTRQGLKAAKIQEYRNALAREPGNMELRNQLVQTLFWNGRKDEAQRESLNILGAHAYRFLQDFESRTRNLQDVLDRTALLTGELRRGQADLLKAREELFEIRRKLSDSLRNGSAAAATLQTQGSTAYRKTSELLNTLNRNSSLQSVQEKALDEEISVSQEAMAQYKSAAAALEWKFQRDQWMKEFSAMISSRDVLASHVAGRILHLEGQDDPALGEILKAASQNVPGAYFIRQQMKLWSIGDVPDPIPEEAAQYRPSWEALPALKIPAAPDEPPEIITPEVLDRLLSGIDRWTASYQAAQNLGKGALARGKTHLLEEVARSFFLLEQETYPLRYELGEYYLSTRDLESADRQFRMVLTMDPRNMSARSRLGAVNSMAGDWYGAMENYRKVYQIDPAFENVTRFHNQLAIQNPDLQDTVLQALADTNRVSLSALGTLTKNLNSYLGLKVSLGTEVIRHYRRTAEEFPSTFGLLTGGTSLLIKVPAWNLSLMPWGSFWLGSGTFSDLSYLTDPQKFNNNSPPGHLSQGSLMEFLSLLGTEPRWGGELSWNLAPFAVWSQYIYGRWKETLVPGRERILAHSGEVQLSGAAGLNSFRIYSSLQQLSGPGAEDNLLWGALGELNGGIHLTDSPWANLGVTASGHFQDSRREELRNYWSPQGVLQLKLLVQLASWWAVPGGDTLGISLRGGGGNYRSGLLGKGLQENFPTAEGEIRWEWTSGTQTWYLALSGSHSFPQEDSRPYWSLGLTGGLNGRHPRILNP